VPGQLESPRVPRPHHRPAPLRAPTGFPWPGNVRELENAPVRAVAVARGKRVALKDLPPEVKGLQEGSLPAEERARMPFRDAVDLAHDRISRDYLVAMFREFEGNVTQAVARAGVKRESLHRLLRQYGIRSDDFDRCE